MKKYLGLLLLAVFIVSSLSVFAQTGADIVSNLHLGLKSSEVLSLQIKLQELGYFAPTTQPTGYFGLNTKKAVQDFQRANGVPATGYVGPLTRVALSKIASSPGGSLTADQIAAFPRCDGEPNSMPLPSLHVCSIGQDVGYYFVAKSINSDNTVTFYVYSLQSARAVGETWSPTVSTYAINQILSDECGTKISIDKINYSEQNFTVMLSAGNGSCSN